MQWEIVVAIILAIGIGTTVMEVLLKRAARKNEAKTAEVGRHAVGETSSKRDVWT